MSYRQIDMVIRERYDLINLPGIFRTMIKIGRDAPFYHYMSSQTEECIHHLRWLICNSRHSDILFVSAVRKQTQMILAGVQSGTKGILTSRDVFYTLECMGDLIVGTTLHPTLAVSEFQFDCIVLYAYDMMDKKALGEVIFGLSKLGEN